MKQGESLRYLHIFAATRPLQQSPAKSPQLLFRGISPPEVGKMRIHQSRFQGLLVLRPGEPVQQKATGWAFFKYRLLLGFVLQE